ncbi:hypothetical protein MWN34_00885 [Ancylobacter sp. 6x-1]|uniref:Uncharacterized protein n=1 Tax=Ancylobacter crimeensis TaxID=2579147 RepID=A0ABT0D686_9HYPH|nr:hypothetical protein [Ancylobacter crimeensis]MCK0195461.1 hypothetical protein [Ancylobacter crimeensis]
MSPQPCVAGQASRKVGLTARRPSSRPARRRPPIASGHVPDFLVERSGVATLLDAVGEGAEPPPPWVAAAAVEAGFRHQILAAADKPAVRLENAIDLLRYARWRAPLGERVRLLVLLEDGPLPLGACLAAMRSPDPMGVVAALALRRFVELDLDDAPIGPDTRVRAIAAAR